MVPTPAPYLFLGFVTPGGETWQGSSEILDRPDGPQPEPPLFPRTRLERLAAPRVERWLQRLLAVWRRLSADDQGRVRHALTDAGWEPVLDDTPRHRLGKRNFRLVLEPT